LAEILSGTVRSTFLFLNEGYTKTLSVGTIEVICLGEQEDLLGRVTDLLDNPLQPGVAVHELLLPVEFIMLPGTPANFWWSRDLHLLGRTLDQVSGVVTLGQVLTNHTEAGDASAAYLHTPQVIRSLWLLACFL
jgi:hypothetical protein